MSRSPRPSRFFACKNDALTINITLISDILNAISAILIALVLMTGIGHAADLPQHDLVFGLNQASDPFKDGVFMLGDKTIKVEQGALPAKEAVAYDADHDKIVVSNDTSLSDADKSAALLHLMDTLSISAIETAAGNLHNP